VHLQQWLARLPAEVRAQITPRIPGAPSGGGSDDASFACHGAPAFGMGGVSWDYGSYTWHTNRDTFDKVVLDDVRFNATLVAMLAYLAAEDPETITRERATAEQISPRGGPGGQGGAFAWPTCQQAPRKTNPRMR
jgi:hypothetical protein